jgi:hypothetical protein
MVANGKTQLFIFGIIRLIPCEIDRIFCNIVVVGLPDHIGHITLGA